MKIVELRNLERKDVPLSYRRTFTADAVVEGPNSGETTQPVEFDLEQSPVGGTEIMIRVVGKSHYPVVPILRALKPHITELNDRGELL